MTDTLQMHFARDQLVYRSVVRFVTRIPTRRQQRLAARRAGTADSFKKRWKAYIADPRIIIPFGYEFAYRLAAGRSIRNAIHGNMRSIPSTAEHNDAGT